MRKKLPIFALLVAWLVAIGGQGELLQAFAWVKMFSGYAQTMSLSESLRATFEPENRCKYCMLAETARQEQAKSPAVPTSDAVAKILLIMQSPADVVVAAAARETALVARQDSWPVGRDAPPTPPPRAALA